MLVTTNIPPTTYNCKETQNNANMMFQIRTNPTHNGTTDTQTYEHFTDSFQTSNGKQFLAHSILRERCTTLTMVWTN